MMDKSRDMKKWQRKQFRQYEWNAAKRMFSSAAFFPAGVHDVYGVRLVDFETLTLSVHFLSGPFSIHRPIVIDLSSKAHSSLGQPRPSFATDCTMTSPIIKASGPIHYRVSRSDFERNTTLLLATNDTPS